LLFLVFSYRAVVYPPGYLVPEHVVDVLQTRLAVTVGLQGCVEASLILTADNSETYLSHLYEIAFGTDNGTSIEIRSVYLLVCYACLHYICIGPYQHDVGFFGCVNFQVVIIYKSLDISEGVRG